MVAPAAGCLPASLVIACATGRDVLVAAAGEESIMGSQEEVPSRYLIASDHAGFELKEALEKAMREAGVEAVDLGTHSADSVDYPLFGAAVARGILAGDAARGVVVCGTGIGISIACNRFPGIRAALCLNERYAELARRHNDANVLALGGRFLDVERAVAVWRVFHETPFEGGRHARRVALLDRLPEETQG